jgi:hypothetical protein
VLKKRGLENSMTFGLIGDCRPTKVAMDDIGNGVGSPLWAVQSHYYCDTWQGYKMKITAALWGIGVDPCPPEKMLAYGWSNPLMLNYFPRETHLPSSLWEHRSKVEKWMGAARGYTPSGTLGYGTCGLGRIGVDFWPVMKDGRGRIRGTIAGRYPEAAWGQLSLQNTTQHIFGRGKNGPVPTVRSEMYRESLQEVEARIYVEKALLDAEARTLLGEELCKRARALLDERIRIGLQPEQAYIADWAKRSEALFQLAADVAGKFGGREPKPSTAAPAKR